MKLVFSLILIGLSIFLFKNTFHYYFFQDDWFILNWIRTNDILSFFEFRTDIIYWRPLSMPIFFWLNKQIFGLNPFWFHAITFIIHLTNSILLGLLVYRLFKNKFSAMICSLMYATASFHFMSLAWISLAWNHIANFFLLTSLLSLLLIKNSKIQLLLSLIFFVFALMSSEFAILYPVFVFYINLLKNKLSFFITIKEQLLLLIISTFIIILYLFFRFILFPIPSAGVYKLILDFKFLVNYFWYIIWLLNVPEVIKYQVNINTLKFSNDPTFIEPFRPFLIPVLVSFITFMTSFFLILMNNINKKVIRVLGFSIIVFCLALSPVVFLPDHSFPYYLSLPSLSFFIFIGYLFSKSDKNIYFNNGLLILFFIISWLAASFLNINFTQKTHWVSGEQAISMEIISKIIKEEKNHTLNNSVIINNSNNQVKQALMNQDAFKVIFNNSELITVYKND